MAHSVCPWWIGYFLASPLRKLRQNPKTILQGHVKKGMVVLEPGPGMGFFTLELARLAGSSGKVIAVDLQKKMLQALTRKAARAGLNARIETRLVGTKGLGINDLKGKVDFVLAFAMVHEVPNPQLFFRETSTCLKAKGRVLFGEPSGHVSEAQFADSLKMAEREGLVVVKELDITGSRTALLEKKAGSGARVSKKPARKPLARKKPAAKRK